MSPSSSPIFFTPTCTVVVCTRDRPAELERCLEALARLDYPHYEVLVVDNAPGDDRAQQIASQLGARYLLEPVVGLSRARNAGALAATTEIIAYLDDDSVPETNWLSSLAVEFSDPTVMAVTGHTRGLGATTEQEIALARIGGAEFGGENREAFDRETPDWFAGANFGGVGVGMNMALRRSVVEDGLRFDMRLGRGAPLHGNEEHRMFFELLKRGHRIIYTPAAIVHHPFSKNVQEVRARHLQALRSSGAYAALLFREERGYRSKLLRAAWRALRGSAGRAGRRTDRRVLQISRMRELMAYLGGAFSTL